MKDTEICTYVQAAKNDMNSEIFNIEISFKFLLLLYHLDVTKQKLIL